MTPIVNLNHQVYFKREDFNTTGSAKDRAIPEQIKNLLAQGYSSAVISSTGNAAISAQHFCRLHHIPLTIFTSPRILPAKLKLLENYQLSSSAISESIRFAKKNKAYLLRQSTDPAAIIGYQAIGREIMAQLPQVTSIFVPVGSGTTLLGISQSVPTHVKIFAVQPANNPTICRYFQPNYTPESTSPTDALTVRYLPQKTKIITTIKDHHGSGIIISTSDCLLAQKELAANNLFTSAEGALTFSGYQKAKTLFDIGNTPLILFTGTKR